MTAHMEAAHYRQALRLAWSEREFTDEVVRLAKDKGWMVAHFRPARTNTGWATAMAGHVGFPDIVLAKDGRVIFAELKSEKGRVLGEQKKWLAHTRGYLWRPSDWPTIVLTLDGYTVSDV